MLLSNIVHTMPGPFGSSLIVIGNGTTRTCYQQGECSQRDKLDRRRSANRRARPEPTRQSQRTLSETWIPGWNLAISLTIPPSSDSRPLVYHSDHQAVSTARFHCAGLSLAIADGCSDWESEITQKLLILPYSTCRYIWRSRWERNFADVTGIRKLVSVSTKIHQ